MALGSLMWGVVIAFAGFFGWSVGGSGAWIGFALVLTVCASLAFALQRTRGRPAAACAHEVMGDSH